MTRRSDPRETRLPIPRGELPAFTPVPRKCERHDGWTPERQRGFIEALADTGSVKAAARAVNMSQEGAYLLRRQPGAEAFRAAWRAALDLGVQKIEDTAMDRALNGVEVPYYVYGELRGTRRVYNDRLLMFMLRNRAPERFAQGRPRGMDAVGKMELRRKKKKWRRQWEEELRGGAFKTAAEARAAIERKLEELRQRVIARRAAEWRTLTPETRAAYRHYEDLRARDLGRAVELPEYALSEEEIAEAEARERAELAGGRPEETTEPAALPAPSRGEPEEAESEADAGPRVQTVKDEG